MEMKCLGRSTGAAGLSWEVGIATAPHELFRTLFDVQDLSDEWAAAHGRFHHALPAACGSTWFLRIREQPSRSQPSQPV
jgi:DNA-binding GntR family transcriptional regulator